MFCEEMGYYAANKALRKLGIGEAKEGTKLIDIPLSDENYEAVTGYEGDGILKLVEGETYIIKTDSGTYTDVCKKFNDVDVWFLGDPTLGGDVPENWDGGIYEVMCGPDWVTAFDVNKGTNISVYEALNTIDQKYLPGVCLPVVEIADISELTESENSAVSACIGMPCILKTQYGTVLCSYSFTSNVHMFFGMYAGEACVLVSSDGATWHNSMG